MTVQETVRARARLFYVVFGAAMIAAAVAGFSQTYFLPLARGQFNGPPILHIHGVLFFGWLILFTVQASLVSSGRTGFHRELGVFGVALATAMVCSVLVATVSGMFFFDSHGTGDSMRVFSWVQVGGMLFFAALVTLAIVNARRPETHKRLMTLATISLLDAPLARVIAMNFMPAPPPGPPMHPPVILAVMGGIAACAFLIAAIVYDWRTRGRPHPVYLWGGAAFVLLQATRVPISESAWWMSVATALGKLGG